MPATSGLTTSSSPTVRPGPVMKLTTPGGNPASRKHCARCHVLIGVSLAGLRITVFPATRAPPIGPPLSAIGKLKGETTAHTPYGFITLRVLEVPSGFIG